MDQLQAYQLFRKLQVEADINFACPSGGSLAVSTDQQNTLRVVCSDVDVLWDSFRLLREFGVEPSLRKVGFLRNPLQQTLQIRIGNQVFVEWDPGNRPNLKSWRLLLRWLRKR